VALFDADGVTLIDSVTIPASLPADKTFGRSSDAVTKGDYLVQSKIWKIMPNVTPSTNNVTLDTNDKVDRFKNNDPDGFAMTITAMSVVFSALLMLFLCFKGVGKLAINLGKRRAKESGNAEESSDIPGEVLAAISTALYELEQDVHDIEHAVLTIRKAKSNYSPWSSKIYSLRENPKK
jgi:Na+-transporting methylmalonyl-CoA/oxaloacetate decarboxylase gamma subunit